MRRLLFLVCLLAGLLVPPVAEGAATFFIRGGGYGHGIGLSQYGADGYALHGKDYRYILAHYYRGTAIGQTDPTQTVRVLLKTGSASFSRATTATGLNGAAKGLHSAWTYTVKALASGSLQLIDPSGRTVGKFAAPLVVSGSGSGASPLEVVGLGSYRGALEFRPDGRGGVQTVDALGLDEYVQGVIAAEMPASWPAQALEAQAVAARTYAITTSVDGSGYTLYPDTRSQMYGGVGAETVTTNAAVQATRGQIVTYRGAPAVTYFFASSGGYTESIDNVWLGATPEPWLVGVPDPYDAAEGADPYHRWGYNLSIARARADLGPLVKGNFEGIRVVRHGVSPRILLADVVGSRGTSQASGAQLQQAFGLPTTLAAFVTLVTLPGPAPKITHSKHATGGLNGFLALMHQVVVAATPALHGTVFPAARGARIAVQLAGSHGWQTVKHARPGVQGAYSVTLPSTGRYRVVYAGLDGPALTIG